MALLRTGLRKSVLVMNPMSRLSLSTTITERYSDSTIIFLTSAMGVYSPTVGYFEDMMADTGSDMVISCTVAKASCGDERTSVPFSPAAVMTSFEMGAPSTMINAEHPALIIV